MTKSAFHAELEHDPSPQEVLRNVNRTLNRLSDDKTFVTFAYVLLDRKGGTAAIATAGHPPVLRRDGRTAEISQIRTPSLGLGLRPDAAFGSVTVQAGPGDSFLLYTDGALELTNRAGEQFGIERLTASFRSRTGGPEEVCAGIVSDLRAFSGSEEFYDDVTLVSIHVSSS
jgi:sigma-B regulation protein RsbU (phosphoserine phosphatase)